MAQAPQLDFDAFVARKKAERAGGGTETTGHEYTYTFDRQSRVAFENTKPVALRGRGAACASSSRSASTSSSATPSR